MLSGHSYEAQPTLLPYDKEEDYRLSQPTMSPMIPLTDLCTHFQDLPSFVHHPDFDHFAYCWMEFQYQISMSQHPHCRPGVQSWLASMSAQALELIAKYPPPPPSHHHVHVAVIEVQEDHEASTYHIRSAYQRLVHRFGVLQKLLNMIDHGSIGANQSPQEVVLPIYNTLLKHKLNQQQFHTPSPLYDYFSITSSPSPTSSSSGMSTPIVPLSLLSLTSPEPTATTSPASTSSFRSPSCMQVVPYLNNSGAPSPHIHPLSLVLPPPPPPPPSHVVQTPLGTPRYHPMSWSTPVTPSPMDHPPAAQFWSSCPVSPSHPRRRCTSLPDPLPLSTQHYQEEDIDEPITPSPLDCRLPPPLTPKEDDKYHPDNDNDEEDEDEEDDVDVDDDDDDDDYIPPATTTPTTPTTSNRKDDPILSPANTTSQRTKHTKRHHCALSFKQSSSSISLVALAPNTSTTRAAAAAAAAAAKIRRRGRTATSYDQDTTHFLKSMFFNIYSQRDKLTKEQRRQVVERTGLKPRNVTYWFSNHKRRFQSDLDVFRKLIAESNGRIQTYDDYVAWRREQGLPEEMAGDNEM